MAVNPLIPYTDLVSGDMSARPAGDAPVGLLSASSSDPALTRGMSPAMAALWSNALAPEPESEFSGSDAGLDMGDDDDDGGSVSHYGVPLPLPPMFGDAPVSPPLFPGSEWRDQVLPENRPKIDTKNHGGVHEFTRDGKLSAEQEQQRRKALGDDRRLDDTKADIADLRSETSKPLPKIENIEPGWEGEREYESDNFFSRFVKKRREAWEKNQAEYERRMSPEGKLAPPMSDKSLQDYGPEAQEPEPQEPETVMAPQYGRPPVASVNPRYVSDDPWQTSKVVETALDLVGMPHRWGGDSYGGADDIGVVRAAYRKAGYELPGVIEAENLPGQRVKLSAMRPGDLLTWRGDADVAGNVRVGVFIGGGQFVTSSLNRGVSVRNVSDLDGKDASGRRVRYDRSASLAGRTPSARRMVREFNDSFDDALDSLASFGGSRRDRDRDGGGGGDRDGGGGSVGRRGDRGRAGTGGGGRRRGGRGRGGRGGRRGGGVGRKAGSGRKGKGKSRGRS